MSTTDHSLTRHPSRWRSILPTLVLMWVVGQIDKGNFGFVVAYHPFLTQMDLLHHPPLIGLLATSFLIAYGVGMPLWGFLVDRWGPRRSAILGLGLWLLMMVLGGSAPSLPILFVSRIILGLSEGVLWPACNAMTSRWFPVDEQNRASAWWINGINIGLGIAGIVTTALLVLIGWRGCFFVVAAFTLVPLTMLWFVHDDPLPKAETAIATTNLEARKAKNIERPLWTQSPLANYRLWLITIANTATGMGIWGVMAWIPKYLVDVRHFSMGNMGIDLSGIWFICIAVLAGVGAWADRQGRRAPFGAAAFLMYGISITLSAIMPNSGLAILFIAIAIWTLQVTTVMVFSMIHGLSSGRSVGVSTGVLAGVSNLVASLAPFVMGILIAATHSYIGAFSFLGGAALIGSGMMAILIPQGY